MNKKYLAPSVQVTTIQLSSIMTTSPGPPTTDESADPSVDQDVKKLSDEDFDEDFEDLDPANGWNGGLW